MKLRETLMSLRSFDVIIAVLLISLFGIVWLLSDTSVASGSVVVVHVFFLIITFLVYFRLRDNGFPSALLIMVTSIYWYLPSIPLISTINTYVGLGFWTFLGLVFWAYYVSDPLNRQNEYVTGGSTEESESVTLSLGPSSICGDVVNAPQPK